METGRLLVDDGGDCALQRLAAARERNREARRVFTKASKRDVALACVKGIWRGGA
jgi:hypothetical protein